jgi:hypothetical protein
MRTTLWSGMLVLTLLVVPGSGRAGQTWPRAVQSMATAMPDSVRLKMLAMIARGDIAGAVECYLLETGATTAPRWLAEYMVA